MTIETVKSGQPRPYADSEYKYILTVEGMDDDEIKFYRQNCLKQCSQTFEQWNEGKASYDVYFRGYYRFSKTKPGKYEYFVLEPYCG
jgi:hypothetical protein